jgi:nucleoside-diphosphate-sugar epimerase
VLHLLQRGEDPRRIRILDIRKPVREDLQSGRATEVDFVQVNVTKMDELKEAFLKPWPEDETAAGAPSPELTVFHTAASIRFFERHPDLLPFSEEVNVQGTQNVLECAKLVGAQNFIYTSSGSVGVRSTRLWLFPWEKEPALFTQVINEDITPKSHYQFFSNYAVSKLAAERMVRAADGSKSGKGTIRTGCIRPGNGIYGPGGDLLAGAYLVRKNNPTWLGSIVQSFCFVENCSLAHLLYEQRLIEIERGTSNPDIGGQAFCVADAGPPPTFGDLHLTLTTLSDGETTFPHFPPTAMLGIAHLVELYCLARHFLLKSIPLIGSLMPRIVGEMISLQPSMFSLTNVHLYFDDSRAREPPEKGGLGYQGHCSTLVGLCQVVIDHKRTGGKGTAREIAGHAATEQSPLIGAEQAVGGVVNKLGDGVDAVKALN